MALEKLKMQCVKQFGLVFTSALRVHGANNCIAGNCIGSDWDEWNVFALVISWSVQLIKISYEKWIELNKQNIDFKQNFVNKDKDIHSCKLLLVIGSLPNSVLLITRFKN